jgi:hypothetical protein
MLSRGAVGPEVTKLQRRLADLGWPLLVDGAFGLRTDAALRATQRELKLTPDGVAGPLTLGRLPSAKAKTRKDPVRALLGVPYHSQRDNENRPSTTCNVTSVAMVLDFFGVDPTPPNQLEDELYEDIMGPEGAAALKARAKWAVGKVNPWTVHDMLVWAAGRRSVTLAFDMTRTWTQVHGEIEAGRPVILGGTFTGAGGHIVVAVGVTSDGDTVVHDPWGDWNRGYRSTDGLGRIYAQEDLAAVVRPDGQIWAHFVTGAP